MYKTQNINIYHLSNEDRTRLRLCKIKKIKIYGKSNEWQAFELLRQTDLIWSDHFRYIHFVRFEFSLAKSFSIQT